MVDANQEIELVFSEGLYPYCCGFGYNDELILYGNIYRSQEVDNYTDCYIWICSAKSSAEFTRAKKVKLNYQRIYNIPRELKMISISQEDNKIYLLSNNSIYQWNINNDDVKRSISVNEVI